MATAINNLNGLLNIQVGLKQLNKVAIAMAFVNLVTLCRPFKSDLK